MNLDTYNKIKTRLGHQKVRYFSEKPEKKINAILAIIPIELTTNIHHQSLLDSINEQLKHLSTNENENLQQRILSLEFIPLSCILSSFDISNQFIIECNSNETKQYLIDKPLKINLNKQTITLDLLSYDDYMQKEYEKFIKSERYKQLLKNHDQAIHKHSATK